MAMKHRGRGKTPGGNMKNVPVTSGGGKKVSPPAPGIAAKPPKSMVNSDKRGGKC
jgi:hypothetical protein